MSRFPPPFAPLVRRRLARFVSQNQVHLENSFASSTQALVQILRKNVTSGRYDRFKKHTQSRARLTPTRYTDGLIATWVRESPRWNQLVLHDNDEWGRFCQFATRAANKLLSPNGSLRGFTAEDFAHQAIELMLHAEYPFDIPFDPWALTILHRAIWGKARSGKDVMDHQPDSFQDLLLLGEFGGAGVEKQFADPLAHVFVQIAGDRDLLWRALAQLQPTLRDVVELYFFGNLTDQEIARRLNTSAANIQTRRHRALRRLRALLAEKPLTEKPRRPH